MFKALVVEKSEAGETSASVQELDESRLPQGDVTVAVEYSTVNYKDGLCIGPGGGLVRTYPHVPGIDFAGTVETSDDPRYSPGDKVVLLLCCCPRVLFFVVVIRSSSSLLSSGPLLRCSPRVLFFVVVLGSSSSL